VVQAEAETLKMTEEDQRDEQEALEQIEQCCKFLRHAGGECQPKKSDATTTRSHEDSIEIHLRQHFLEQQLALRSVTSTFVSLAE